MIAVYANGFVLAVGAVLWIPTHIVEQRQERAYQRAHAVVIR